MTIGGTEWCGHGVMRRLCPECTPGAPDWADLDADTHLRYLRKCHSVVEEREYLAAALRLAASKGAAQAIAECAAKLNVELKPHGDRSTTP